jgi:methylated-DNA-[protein]-cysteine S-methyltransferase
LNNTFFYRSPLGPLRIAEENGSLVSAAFVDDGPETVPSSPVLSEAKDWLDRYFQGSDPGPTPSLAPGGTAFQRSVWAAIARVPFGETVSYSDLVVSMDLSPCHARAVGNALHKNPLLLFIPCHRAVGKSGSLTGFAGGLGRKEALLKIEQQKACHISAVRSV